MVKGKFGKTKNSHNIMTMVVQRDLRKIKDGYTFSKVFITKIYQIILKKNKTKTEMITIIIIIMKINDRNSQ